jgi:signal transduction histidine kinase
VGLAAALDELASNAENIFGIDCTFEETGKLEFRDLSVADHLYRIAQEAISNAVKHGGAKQIKVQLFSKGDQIRMEIADDGSGIQPKIEQVDGMGLRIMHYRAKMIGARVDVRHRGPNAGSGTIVVCEYRRLPNDQNAEA